MKILVCNKRVSQMVTRQDMRWWTAFD
jgi:hypothetical protein